MGGRGGAGGGSSESFYKKYPEYSLAEFSDDIKKEINENSSVKMLYREYKGNNGIAENFGTIRDSYDPNNKTVSVDFGPVTRYLYKNMPDEAIKQYGYKNRGQAITDIYTQIDYNIATKGGGPMSNAPSWFKKAYSIAKLRRKLENLGAKSVKEFEESAETVRKRLKMRK